MGLAQASEFLGRCGRRCLGLRDRSGGGPTFQPARFLLGAELTIPEATLCARGLRFRIRRTGRTRGRSCSMSSSGAGMAANAYYAAFRLPDTLFSLIAGGALSSAIDSQCF